MMAYAYILWGGALTHFFYFLVGIGKEEIETLLVRALLLGVMAIVVGLLFSSQDR